MHTKNNLSMIINLIGENMSDLKYLISDKQCLECELELIEEYVKFRGVPQSGEIDYAEDGRRLGMTELNNLEIKFGTAFLKKRIAWFETQIEKEERKERT